MSMRRRSRGTTLPELLVYSALLGVVMSMVAALFNLCLGAWRSVDSTAEVHGQAQVAMDRMVAELAGASDAAFETAPDGVAFVSANSSTGLQYDAHGRVLWQKAICYYTQDGRLLRKERRIAPTSSAAEVGVNLRDLRNDRNLPEVVVARSIRGLQVTATGSSITLALRAGNEQSHVSEVNVSCDVSLRQ